MKQNILYSRGCACFASIQEVQNRKCHFHPNSLSPNYSMQHVVYNVAFELKYHGSMLCKMKNP